MGASNSQRSQFTRDQLWQCNAMTLTKRKDP
jgi:hypothetical protein